MEPFSTDWFIRTHCKLFLHFGDPKWWPGETPFEVAVGAVLTQNTSWSNVERAIKELKNRGYLSPGRLLDADQDGLKDAIRPAGYFNQKSAYLKELSRFISEELDGDVPSLSSMPPGEARGRLLALRGIGEETADSILCYGAGMPVFVVDAYTCRIMSRISPGDYRSIIGEGSGVYNRVQDLVMGRISGDAVLYNRLHALMVLLGKDICRARPLCEACPLLEDCSHGRSSIPAGIRKKEK